MQAFCFPVLLKKTILPFECDLFAVYADTVDTSVIWIAPVILEADDNISDSQFILDHARFGPIADRKCLNVLVVMNVVLERAK